MSVLKPSKVRRTETMWEWSAVPRSMDPIPSGDKKRAHKFTLWALHATS